MLVLNRLDRALACCDWRCYFQRLMLRIFVGFTLIKIQFYLGVVVAKGIKVILLGPLILVLGMWFM